MKDTSMKKTIFLLTGIMLVAQLTAQTHRFQYLRDTYRGKEGVVSLYIPGFLCRFAASIGNLDQPEEELLRSIRSMRILVIENPALNRRVRFIDEVNVKKLDDQYETLMAVHEKDEEVWILAKEKKGKVRDLLIIVSGDENVLVQIKGRVHRDLFKALYEVTGLQGTRYVQDI